MRLFRSLKSGRLADPPAASSDVATGSEVSEGMGEWWRDAEAASGAPTAGRRSIDPHEVYSFVGGKLAIGEDGFLVHHSDATSNLTRGAVAFILPVHPDLVFLSATSGPAQAISSQADPNDGPILSYVVERRADGSFALRNPLSGRFLSAGPFADRPVRLVCDRESAQDWELFRLSPHAGRMERAWADALEAGLGSIPADLTDPDAIVDYLRDTAPSELALAAAAVLRFLPPQSTDAVIERLSALGMTDRIIRTVCRADPWFEPGWKALADWSIDRRRRPRQVADANLDFVAAGRTGPMSLCHLATLRARAAVEPREEIAVLATIWNDGPYILQWIAHHRALGASGIFLYSVDGQDRSEDLLGSLAEHGVITWIRCRNEEGVSRHRKAYTHYMSCLPDGLDHRWSAILDIDEFIVLNGERYRSLSDFLDAREAEGATAIALSRQMFVHLPGNASISRPLIERTVTRFPRHDREIKTIFRSANFHSSHAHDPAPIPGVEWTFHNASGTPHHWPGRLFNPALGEPMFEDAWVNSYRIKSIDETIWEASKPTLREKDSLQPGYSPVQLLQHLKDRAQDALVEDRCASAHLPGLLRELSALRALAGVREAEKRVLETHARENGRTKALLREQMARDPILRGIAASVLTAGEEDGTP